MFLVALLTITLVLVLYFVGKFLKKNKLYSKLKNFVYDRVFFNGIIRVFIQSYLTLVLSAYFNLKSMILRGDPILVVSSLTAIAIGVTLTSFPFFMFSFMKHYNGRLHKKRFVNRVGTMYAGLELDGRLSPLLYNVIFVARRLIFTYSIIFFS